MMYLKTEVVCLFVVLSLATLQSYGISTGCKSSSPCGQAEINPDGVLRKSLQERENNHVEEVDWSTAGERISSNSRDRTKKAKRSKRVNGIKTFSNTNLFDTSSKIKLVRNRQKRSGFNGKPDFMKKIDAGATKLNKLKVLPVSNKEKRTSTEMPNILRGSAGIQQENAYDGSSRDKKQLYDGNDKISSSSMEDSSYPSPAIKSPYRLNNQRYESNLYRRSASLPHDSAGPDNYANIRSDKPSPDSLKTSRFDEGPACVKNNPDENDLSPLKTIPVHVAHRIFDDPTIQLEHVIAEPLNSEALSSLPDKMATDAPSVYERAANRFLYHLRKLENAQEEEISPVKSKTSDKIFNIKRSASDDPSEARTGQSMQFQGTSNYVTCHHSGSRQGDIIVGFQEFLEFNSPDYPNPYPNNLKCLFRFEIPAGRGVELTCPVHDLGAGDTLSIDGLDLPINPNTGTLFPTRIHRDFEMEFTTDAEGVSSGFMCNIAALLPDSEQRGYDANIIPPWMRGQND